MCEFQSESEMEILKRINREILNLKNVNDQRAADEYFYFTVPDMYKEDVAENFNDSNWMHYTLLDSCQKSSFARTMLNLSYDDDLNLTSAMFCPFNAVSFNPSEVAECQGKPFAERLEDEVLENEYEELINFKKDMLTVLNIIMWTYIVLVASYLLMLIS